MAIQLATSGSAGVAWSSPGSGRNAYIAGSIEFGLSWGPLYTPLAGSLRNFDDQSCAQAATLRSWLVGGAVEPRQGWGARGDPRSLSRRPSGLRALPTSRFDKSHRLRPARPA